MAGFNVLGDVNDTALKRVDVSTLTAAIGDLLELVAGATTWAKTTSSTNFFTRKGILMETLTSASTALILELDGSEKVEADATNTANTAHNGDRMVLTDENAVNNTGTDNTGQTACFVQDNTGRNTTKIVGRVIVGSGVDPDAT